MVYNTSVWLLNMDIIWDIHTYTYTHIEIFTSLHWNTEVYVIKKEYFDPLLSVSWSEWGWDGVPRQIYRTWVDSWLPDSCWYLYRLSIVFVMLLGRLGKCVVFPKSLNHVLCFKPNRWWDKSRLRNKIGLIVVKRETVFV